MSGKEIVHVKKFNSACSLVGFFICGYNFFVPVLYIVGTPIGNLGDITFRAVETLKNADVIACEDTRHTLQLLTHFEIRKPLISCRAQNESIAAQKIISLLEGLDTDELDILYPIVERLYFSRYSLEENEEFNKYRKTLKNEVRNPQ